MEDFLFMSIWELLIIAVGLSMDAFAVSICKGLSVQKLSARHAVTAGIYFGGFQLLMPLAGYILGNRFEWLITSVDNWIAFALLTLIGGNMIRESFGRDEELNDSFNFKTMLPLAIATSIDALAVGVTFACMGFNFTIISEWFTIIPAVCIIGVITFAISAAGIKIGNVFGLKYKSKAEFVGGLVLVLMGIKFLVEQLIEYFG